MTEENINIALIEKFKSNIDINTTYTIDQYKKFLVDSYKSLTKKEKTKRTASEYNLFIKEQMLEIKKANPTKNNKEVMSEAALKWKEYKETRDKKD